MSCGSPEQPTEKADEVPIGTESQAALYNCTTSCPSGMHATSYYCNHCWGGCFSMYDSVECANDTFPSFYKCGYGGCPSGYVASSYSSDYDCCLSPGCTPGLNKTLCKAKAQITYERDWCTYSTNAGRRTHPIEIYGTNFSPSSNSVTVGGYTCSVTYNSSTQINCELSGSTPTGTRALVVTPSGGVASDPLNITVSTSGTTIKTVHDQYSYNYNEAHRNYYVALYGCFGSSPSVTIGGVSCAVDYSVPRQINCLVNGSTPTGYPKSLVVTSDGSDSKDITVY